MVSALINNLSALGFSKACLVCHGFENLDFSPVAESTAWAEVVGASDPRCTVVALPVGRLLPLHPRCAVPSLYGHGREDIQRLHRGQGTDVALRRDAASLWCIHIGQEASISLLGSKQCHSVSDSRRCTTLISSWLHALIFSKK